MEQHSSLSGFLNRGFLKEKKIDGIYRKEKLTISLFELNYFGPESLGIYLSNFCRYEFGVTP
jgi:hypothetical protein